MWFNKAMLLIAVVGWMIVTWKLRAVLRERNPRVIQLYVWTMTGFGLSATSYLIRVIYSSPGVVNIPAFVFCIGGTFALFIAFIEWGRIYRERRDGERK